MQNTLCMIFAGAGSLFFQVVASAPFADWTQLFATGGPMALLVGFFVWQTWQRELHWKDERARYQDHISKLETQLFGGRNRQEGDM